MQSGDLKLLAMGVLSIGFLGYYFNKYTQQQKLYKQKIKQFNQCYEYSQKNNHQRLTTIMTQKNPLTNQTQVVKEKKFCFIDVKPKYNDSTFSIYERQRSLFQKYDKYPNFQILQHQMGGNFTFKSNYSDIICQLNDFCLSGQLLYEKQKTPVHIFKGLNKIQPIVCTVLTALQNRNLSIYGKLFYDENQMKWTIQPFFLTPAHTLKSTVQQFYKDKSQWASYLKFAIIVSSLVIGYFTIFKPLKSYFGRKKSDIFKQGNDIDFFKYKEYISVKGGSLLNCQICQDKHVQIVYECGHLALCKQCHESNLEKICPLCKKQSKKFMKIFMA